MSILQWLNPRRIVDYLRVFDEQAEQERVGLDQHNEKRRVWYVIAVACLCLLLVHYVKYSNNVSLVLTWWDALTDSNLQLWYRSHEYRELIGYVWWGFWNLAGFLFIPMLAIRFILRDSLANYGWQKGDVAAHWLGYVLLATPIICFAVIASFGNDFSRHYPFYKMAHASWFDLLAWETIYILQFVAVEFFFRGFLVNGLRRQFGSLSIAVMCLPYLMLHFPKLWPESFGAILFGFFLGVLALLSRSIWGGVGVHVGIALTMDIAALLQTRGLPDSFWR
ncbi:CPBP family intramembrane glutamic endopeptidase [Thalassolituus oleivorans]|uniref:CPBP family intramembrane glutamic endopeptidase n=1 Tax=Thalassolituus oleivorans TaxID=187493 RepID=UPI0023F55378|nr:CPBP family intramembrane glutamic endopeptidase [Thalassolituus oleivorans]